MVEPKSREKAREPVKCRGEDTVRVSTLRPCSTKPSFMHIAYRLQTIYRIRRVV